MITQIKNANLAKLTKVNVKFTRSVYNVASILSKEGFIEMENDKCSSHISIKIKYKSIKQIPYITNIVYISKPGLRVFVNKKKIPRVWGGIGLCLLSIRYSLQF